MDRDSVATGRDPTAETIVRPPFILGIVPVYALVLASLLSWWWTMSILFNRQDVLAGSVVAFVFPGLTAAVGLVASLRRDGGAVVAAAGCELGGATITITGTGEAECVRCGPCDWLASWTTISLIV